MSTFDHPYHSGRCPNEHVDEYLLSTLSSGPQLPSQVFGRGTTFHMTEGQLRAAAKRLGVDSRRVRGFAMWSLTPQTASDPSAD